MPTAEAAAEAAVVKQDWACVGVLVNVYTNIIHIEVERGGFRERDPFKTAVAAAASVTGMRVPMCMEACTRLQTTNSASTFRRLQFWLLIRQIVIRV
jgi:hypothetical protein